MSVSYNKFRKSQNISAKIKNIGHSQIWSELIASIRQAKGLLSCFYWSINTSNLVSCEEFLNNIQTFALTANFFF